MKHLIYKFICILTISLFSLNIHAAEYDFTSGDLCFTIISEENRTVKVASTLQYDISSITIPSKVTYQSNTYSVTTIGEKAFCNCQRLTSITIPNSVTTIGNSTFFGCSKLTSITISNSVTTIGEYAFYDCTTLTSITIPSSVTTIGKFAFHYCESLAEINVDPNNPSYKSIEGILYSKDGSKLILCPEALTTVSIPNSVTTIGEFAFCECQRLTSITIPNSVTTIGNSAFYGCKRLTSVAIPNSVTTIGEDAFSYCKRLTSVTIPNSVTTIGEDAFYDCENLAEITVDSNNPSYKSIAGILYSKDGSKLIRCPQTLTSVSIPNSVTTIGKTAFTFCDITSVTIPNSVTTIESYAFNSCYSLTSITIPNSVTTIGEDAFYCESLASIYYSSENPISSTSTIFSNTTLKECILYVPKGSKQTYETVDPWCNFSNIEELNFTDIDIVNAENMPNIKISGGRIYATGLNNNTPIEIYDTNGRLLYRGTNHTINDLQPGLYIIRIGKYVSKFLI